MNTTDVFLSAVRYAVKMYRSEQRRLIKTIRIARENGVNVDAIANAAGMHRSTVYRLTKDRDSTESPGGAADQSDPQASS